MRWQDNFVGALTLRHQTFAALRERSDVFWRGFVVLFIAGIIAGAFGALVPTIGSISPLVTKEQVLAIANASFEQNYNGPPALRQQIQPYVTEIASMIYELETLPPRAGEATRPLAALLNYIGMVIATPFGWEWIGWILFGGILFHFTSRLLGGRASMAQMLGLTCLAAAPKIFTAFTGLLALVALTGGIGFVDGLNSLLGFLIALWTGVVYVKATAVAQQFSWLRALGAVGLGLVIFFALCLAAVFLFGILISLLIVPFTRGFQ